MPAKTIALLIMLCCCGWQQLSAAPAAPLEVYGRLPDLEEVCVSPDGTRIAFVRTLAEERVVAVVSLNDGKALSGLRIGQVKLREISWADNDNLLLVASTTTLPWGLAGQEHEWFVLQVYNVSTNRIKVYPEISSSRTDTNLMNVLAGDVMVRRVNGHTVLFIPGIYVTDRTLLALIRVDLQSKRQSVIRKGTRDSQYWLVDNDGEITAEQNYDEEKQHWWIKIRRDGRLQEVASGDAAIDVPHILGFGPSPNTLLIQSIESGDPVWRLMSLQDGSLGPPMAEKQTLGSPIEDPVTHRMVGGVHVGDSAAYVFFDRARQAQWQGITQAYGGERVRLASASDDFRKIVVRVDGPITGYKYALVDMNTHKASVLGDVYDGMPKPLLVRKITYPATDGMQIPAFVTLPRGRAPQKLPLVVLPHGGPASRDTADFDWWAQALAEQGYAVLQPNFRGSSIDFHFISTGFGEWGRKMQTDLSDGVRFLAHEGMIDPARVCIVGGSYGGYAALAGVTLDPGVYRCAISTAGISDLKRMLLWVNERHLARNNAEQRYWDRFMGVSGPNDPLLDTISPIRHVDAVAAPVLLIHGKDDTVVPYEQSDLMYDALRRAKKPVELVTLKREDHWLSRSETRLQMLQTSIAFLRTHNPPD